LFIFARQGSQRMIQVTINGEHHFKFKKEEDIWQSENAATDYSISWLPNGLISILHEGKSYTAIVEKADFKNKELLLRIQGKLYTATIKEPIDQLLSSMGMNYEAQAKAEVVKAPMPGMVLKILVTPGQVLKKGDGLLILEAMKMENVLKAAHDGTVKTIRVAEQTAVEKGAVLIELE
jgi:biotin carboxyl carrier protein